MKNIIFVNTHPIQYFVPLYQQVHQSGLFAQSVFYSNPGHVEAKLDKEFGIQIKWDIPLLSGYRYKIFDTPILGYFSLAWSIIKSPQAILVVHGWNSIQLFLAIVMGAIRGHLVCLRAETPFSHEVLNKGTKKWRNIYLKILFSLVNQFHFIGQQNKAFYLSKGIAASKLFHVPYAVNNAYFSEQSQLLNKWEVRRELRLDSQKRIFLFVGKLIPKKRPLDLLNAFILACPKNCHLVFVGEGELREDLENVIQSHNKSDQIFLLGFKNQTEMAAMYAMADVFVMCSGVGETWGLAINEAMNFSLPVLVSDLTGSAEDLVQPNKNGFIFATSNTKELAQHISFYDTCNEEVVKSHGAFSKHHVQSFSYNAIIDALAALSPGVR